MNAKRKGNKFERVVASWLTNWSGYKFERNRAGSGAWWSNKDAGADITCTDPKHAHRCRISVECKTYKDIRFEHILLGNKNCRILEFWEQATRDAERTNKLPLLCMRYNSMPKGEFFFVISQDFSPSLSLALEKSTYLIIHTNDTSHNLMVFMSRDILSNVDYKDIHKQAKKLLK